MKVSNEVIKAIMDNLTKEEEFPFAEKAFHAVETHIGLIGLTDTMTPSTLTVTFQPADFTQRPSSFSHMHVVYIYLPTYLTMQMMDGSGNLQWGQISDNKRTVIETAVAKSITSLFGDVDVLMILTTHIDKEG